ncbi:MAG: integrase [Burkholderiales bacterium PBB3]|nr:MAG: integrase [Burkholderiales bacterium PBB3]
MGSIRLSDTTETLFFDFRYLGERFREYSALEDTPLNRKKLQKVLDKIEAEINAGTFAYENYFPNSKALERILKARQAKAAKRVVVLAELNGEDELASPEPKPVYLPCAVGPVFQDFANQWVDERSIEWRRSHIKSLLSTLNGHLIPYFGGKVVGSINKTDVLAFRASLAKVKGRGTKEGLSAKRINEIIGLLRQILNEAADRFEFTSPMTNIKKLRQQRVDVDPFSLVDVQRILATVRADYTDYFTTRFFTGMRTGEVHGLKWKYVDFDLRVLRIRETFVLGEDDYTKTDGSQRDIQMSQPVFEALKRQFEVTGKVSEYVFCNLTGQPLDNKNFSDRVWYPLLRHLDLKKRRPYQMRHTAATLWLASGEAPEWIARQLGHTSTEMLFRVYSRYVPNLTRQDGSAMERLLASKLSQGPLIEQSGTGQYVPAQEVPKPRGLAAKRSVFGAGQVRASGTPVPPTSQPPPIRWQFPSFTVKPGSVPHAAAAVSAALQVVH